MTPGFAQLTLRLGTLLSGATAPEWKNTDMSKVTIVDCYEVSGLRREAWCKTLGISDPTWAAYRAGTRKVPAELLKLAIKVALNGGAVQLFGVDIEASAKLSQIELILKGEA